MAGIVWGIHPPIVAPDREPIMSGKVSFSVRMRARRYIAHCTLNCQELCLQSAAT